MEQKTHDEYLESLYLERELHQITISNARKFRPEVVEHARKMLATTEERIKLREYLIEKGLA